ncbi:MAG: c-type cytochrome [Alphaproteobacteria bacterium]|nr:c-type cytochrome [Alphaproteobacteria bacterium]
MKRWLLLGLLVCSGAQAADDLVARGKYLTILGDCAACHTRKDGPELAGGVPLDSGFGTIYSRNITPDVQTGIGGWTADQFYRAMHSGRSADGSHLYPAFPYPYFTHMTRADDDAIFAYLKTVPAVSYKPPPNKLPFPLNIRGLMSIWNALYFTQGEYKPDPARSAAWNRGAYLVTGLGHCGGCHTPKDWLMGDENDRALSGGVVEHWFAADLTGNTRGGLASWSANDTIEYLKTGRNARATASGPMGEVAELSTSQTSDADLAAIAEYIKSLAPSAQKQPSAPDPAAMHSGEAIFVDACASCHLAGGKGQPYLFPPLAGNASVQGSDPTTIVRLVLDGSRSPSTAARPTPNAMPAFGWKLDDRQVADVVTYVRNSWGNAGEPVEAGAVAKLRKR